MTKIGDFYPGTTKAWSMTITLNGAIPDIRADTVTFRMKADPDVSDAQASLTKAADVATSGLSGIALFTLLPADTTALAPGPYSCDVVWLRAGGAEYVIYSSSINLLDRVSDA